MFILKLHPFCQKIYFASHTQIIAILEFYSKEPSFGLKAPGSKKKINCDLSKKIVIQFALLF
jgi:hypothetical protein